MSLMEQTLNQSVIVSKKSPVVLHAHLDSRCEEAGGGTLSGMARCVSLDGDRSVCVTINDGSRRSRIFSSDLRSGDRAVDYTIEEGGLYDWKVISQLLGICRKESVGIWHSHDSHTNLLGLLLQRYWPIRLVTTIHQAPDQEDFPYPSQVENLCLPYYDRVICESLDQYEQVRDIGVPADRCVLLEIAIDTQRFRRSSNVSQAKRCLSIPPHRFIIGVHGHLLSEPKADLLFRAVRHLLDCDIDLGVVVVEETDADSNDFRSETPAWRRGESFGLADRLYAVQYRFQQRDFYECMDVIFFDSLPAGSESYLLKALALEVPVVAARSSNVARIITSHVNGLLIEPGSQAEFIHKLETLIHDPQLPAQLSQRGREIIERFYSLESRMAKIQRLYEELWQAEYLAPRYGSSLH